MNFLHPPPRALSEENRLIALLNNLAGAMSTKGEANCLQQRIAIASINNLAGAIAVNLMSNA
ncbi:hypothetical protein QHH11_18175 [Aphanizomenon sp. PH219]|nr:hypothetical protein [Aphanizomenon sp. 202]MDK2461035.1 hypothetical protein [Aphanizomenon sp. PH219]